MFIRKTLLFCFVVVLFCFVIACMAHWAGLTDAVFSQLSSVAQRCLSASCCNGDYD